MTPPRMMLSGTWTLDPLLPTLDFWRELLQVDVTVDVAPYGQVFQQLLDPGSEVRKNAVGANVLCLRWEDLAAVATGADGALQVQALATRVEEMASAIAGFTHRVPCLVVVGPSAALPAYREASAALATRLRDIGNVAFLDGADAMARYRVERVADAASDRFGHVPYTQEALAALATEIFRWYSARVRKPVKMFAVDGDHTLWSGVVGEAGVDGVRIEAGHTRLQQALRRQAGAGRLLCLLSKNEASDAQAVFSGRSDMALAWKDFIAHRVDWNAKPDNLRQVMSELELGLDSAVFLDDNPVECAQMRLQSPSTLTVRVPDDAAMLSAFVDHLWLFDSLAGTEEDRKRVDLYRDNAARAELKREAGSLRAFLDSLQLEVEIAEPQPADVPRLSQLTLRTNQFNASLERLQEGDVLAVGQDAFHRLVRVRDRFGDYGLVGQLRGRAIEDRLEIDLFMLSCRSLGRGVEHRMVAAAGRHAVERGLAEVAVRFRAGERNTPVRKFLEQVFDSAAEGDACVFRISSTQAASLLFDPSDLAEENAEEIAAPVSGVRSGGSAHGDPGAIYEHIAHTLTSASVIVDAIAARSRPRPELMTGYVEPAPGMERAIADIWKSALRLDAVGVRDAFNELGGKSIQLVHVHRLLLDRLGIDVDITTLFQHPTVASLAAHLSPGAASTAGLAGARERGERMRKAQAGAAALRRQAHNARTRNDA